MRIGIVLGSASRLAGGLFHSVRKPAINLCKLGVSVGVHALHDHHSTDDCESWRPIKPRFHEPFAYRFLGYSPDLGKALHEANYDVLHQHGIWQIFSAQVLGWSRRTGRPVVITPRGMLDKWALRNSAWKKRIARVAFEDANLRAASCIQALNDSEVRAIRSLGLRNPIALIPNGIDVPDSSVTADRPTYLPNDGRRTLLFVGRIHPKKGLKELVQAWAAVHAAAPAVAEGWRLVIAGWDDGDHLHDLLHLTTSLKLEDKIVFPGPLYGREKHAALIHADAFILPSLSEGLPMSVLEAWSYGAPVFMTDECNLGEAFEEGAAIRIENDPVLLARALAKGLASEPPILRQIGDKGRLLVTRRYTREAVTAQYLELYDWLLGRTRHPPKFVQFTP